MAGQIQSRLRIVRPVTWFGYTVGALGFGIFYGFWNWDITMPMQYGSSIVPALGIGLSLQSPMLILQAAMPLKDMAAVTSAWVLTRSIGGSVGVSVYTAVLNSDMRSEFAKVQDRWGQTAQVPTSAAGYLAIHEMPDGPYKNDILRAFADSFKPCWIMATALLAFCLAITVPTRAYSLNRPRGAAAKTESPEGEGEGDEPAEASEVERLEAKVAEEDARATPQIDEKAEPYSMASTPTLAASTDKERSRSRERGRDEAAL